MSPASALVSNLRQAAVMKSGSQSTRQPAPRSCSATVSAAGPQFDVVAGSAATHQHRMAGPVQQRGDRRADGAGTDESNGGGDRTENTCSRLGTRPKPADKEYLCCAATPPVR